MKVVKNYSVWIAQMRATWPVFFIVACVGIIGGVMLNQFNIVRIGDHCDTSKYKYINTELRCDSKLIIKKSAYAQLKYKLLEFIEENKEQNNTEEVSIYFRDLQNGPTLGIDEHKAFSPASLLKVPLLLTYFNLQDSTVGLFERKLILEKKVDDVVQNVVPKESIAPNVEYAVSDLLRYMIKYSDNESYYLLLEYLREISPEKDLLKETFVDLGIIDPQSFTDQTLSVKAYGSIFVQLYHSSYFNNKETSEKVLTILADIDWKDGLNAGVPEGIQVAHKFGERNDYKNNLKQLHDCGVVYFPENPYLLCVMTRGKDFSKLAGVIAEISKMVYEEVDSRKL
jgi:beta-lactamase class A